MRILADEDVDEIAIDDGDIFIADRTADAGRAFIGVDQQEVPFNPVWRSAGFIGDGPAWLGRFQLRVDIHRAGQKGFADGFVVIPFGADMQAADAVDFHYFLLLGNNLVTEGDLQSRPYTQNSISAI